MRVPSNAMPMPNPVRIFLGLASEDAWSALPADALVGADTITLTIAVRRTDGSRIVSEKKITTWELYSCFGEEESEDIPSQARHNGGIQNE